MYFTGAKSDLEYVRFLSLEMILNSIIFVSVQPPSVKRES